MAATVVLVVGLVEAEAGEDVQGVLPVFAGLLGLVQRVVGMGEPVVGAGLIVGLVQFGREREGLVVVGKRRHPGGRWRAVVGRGLARFELAVAVAALPGEVEQLLVVVGWPARAGPARRWTWPRPVSASSSPLRLPVAWAIRSACW